MTIQRAKVLADNIFPLAGRSVLFPKGSHALEEVIALARGSWGHSVPVLDESIPATGHHLGCFVRMPQATDTHCVMRFELAVGQQARYNVSSSCRRKTPDTFSVVVR